MPSHNAQRAQGGGAILWATVALAFFDLDKTILSENSGALWIRHEVRAGHVSLWQAARASAWLFGYHLGLTAMDEVLLEALATLEGTSACEARTRTAGFYQREVRHLVRPGARLTLAAHRAAGDALVLLTTSTGYLSELVADDLGIPHVLCNRFEVDRGLHTGRPLGPLCYGPGKWEHARALAGSLGERLEDAVFYTDSFSDLPVLEAVGRPVAVHPDPRLRREAVRRGWPIEHWGR